MKKLPVAEIVTSAFTLSWKNRAHFSYVLAMPTLALVVIWAIWITTSHEALIYNFIFYITYLLALVYFAITCHRLILVESEPFIKFGVKALKTVLIFFTWATFLYLLELVIEYIFINIFINFGNGTSITELSEPAIKQDHIQTQSNIETARYIFYLPAMYFFGRLSLVLPATAVGVKSGLKWSWSKTRHNGMRILVIVGVFPWALQMLIWLLQRADATAVEKSVIGMLIYISSAIGIFALSLTYKFIRNNEE